MKNDIKPTGNISPLLSFGAGILLGGLITYTLFSRSGSTPSVPDCGIEVAQIIDYEKAKDMYDTYSERRVPMITEYEVEEQSLTSFEPTRFGYYSFDDLNNYMVLVNCIDQKIKDESNNQDSIESIRIYFGNYPNSTTFENGDPMHTSSTASGGLSYRGRNTFMLLPTTMINGIEQGFLYKENPTFEIASFNAGVTGYESLILNEAGLRPPPPPPSGNDFD